MCVCARVCLSVRPALCLFVSLCVCVSALVCYASLDNGHPHHSVSCLVKGHSTLAPDFQQPLKSVRPPQKTACVSNGARCQTRSRTAETQTEKVQIWVFCFKKGRSFETPSGRHWPPSPSLPLTSNIAQLGDSMLRLGFMAADVVHPEGFRVKLSPWKTCD